MKGEQENFLGCSCLAIKQNFSELLFQSPAESKITLKIS